MTPVSPLRMERLKPVSGGPWVRRLLGQAAMLGLLLAGSPTAGSGSPVCGREVEPNDAPEAATRVSPPLCIEGEIGAGDQDLLLLTTVQPQVWRFRIEGVSGQQTRLDIHALNPGPDPAAPPQPGLRLATQTAGAEAPALLLGPGTWLLGLSVSGGAGAWRLVGEAEDIAPAAALAAALTPATPLTGVLGPEATAVIRIDAAAARKRWRLVLDAPLGETLPLTLEDAEGRRLWEASRTVSGPIVLPDLGLEAGDYRLGLRAPGAKPLPWRLRLEADGPRLPRREDEPNDRPESARPLAPARPVSARLAGDGDLDLWRFEVAPGSEGRLFALSAKGPGGAGRRLCLKDAAGVDLQCRFGADAELADLALTPGTYLVAVGGPAEPQTSYEVALRPSGNREPGRETEPNDERTQAQALVAGEVLEGRFVGQETDRYALAAEDGQAQLWRIETEGAQVLRVEEETGRMVAERRLPDAAGRLALDDLALPPGRYFVAVEGANARYPLLARPMGAPQAGSEEEPNDQSLRANRLLPGEQRRGRLADPGDRDLLRFSLRGPARLGLALAYAGAGQISFGLTGGDLAQSELVGTAGLRLERLFEAGDYEVQLTPLLEGGGAWDLRLDWLDPYGDQGAVLPITLEAVLDPDRAAAWWPEAQRLQGRLQIHNRGRRAETLRLEGLSAIPEAQIVFATPEVRLEPGAQAAVPFSLEFAPDTPAGAALVGLRALAGDGRSAGTTAGFALDAQAQVQGPHFGAPPPPALRGGFNLASAAFGGHVAGAAASALDKATADNPRALFDGVASPIGYRVYPTAGAEPPAVRVEFGAGEPVPVAGFVLHPQAELGLAEGAQLRRFEIALSGDGRGFAPVLTGELPRPPREVFFTLPKPVAARAAELRLLEGRHGPGLEMALAEWSVIGAPGHPAGARLNLADPTRGGHVVRADPSLGTPEGLADILAAGGPSPVVKVAAGQVQSLVIAFADDRAAAVTEVQWRETPAPGGTAQALGDVLVAAGETPLGPWQELGRLSAPEAGGRRLALAEPTWARFLRLAAAQAPTADGDWLYPSEIRVMERPVGPQTPSSLGEWGMGLAAAGREAAAPAKAQPPTAEADGDSAAAPQDLTWEQEGFGRVDLGQDEDWWAFTPPPGAERIEIALSGAPVVLATARLLGPGGEALALRRLPGVPGLARFEARVVPGTPYRVQVLEPPRSVAVAIDVSGSLAPYWDALRRGLVAFAEGLRPGRDFVNIIPFEQEFAAKEWTDQPLRLRRTLTGLATLITGSNVEKTTRDAVRGLSGREGLRALLLLTDGATASFPERSAMWAALERADVQVFTGHVGGWDNPVREKQLLQDLAAVGGGHYAHLQTQAEIDRVLERAAAWMRRPARYGLRVGPSTAPPPQPGHIRVLMAAPGPVPAGAPGPGGAGPVEAPPPKIAGPRPAVALALDASGSMLQRLGAKRRIDAARSALTALVTDRLAPGTPLSLRAFGDDAPGSCASRLRVPLAPLDARTLAAAIGSIEPVNGAKTPIAATLRATAEDLSTAQGPRVVVLATDGEETCGGDPKAEIAALRASGVDVRVNIVGFALEDPALAATFRDWAETGGGRFFPAADEGELAKALAEATGEGFQVLGPDGAPVAAGLVGGPTVEVPAGHWQVSVGQGRVVFDAVKLAEGEGLTLVLPTN